MTEVIVLGAGIVGVSAAIHLQQRGFSVLLVDRGAPGQETSFGNGGIIQAEGVKPRAFPRDMPSLMKAAFNRGIDSRYRLSSLGQFADPLRQYWWHSEPSRYAKIVREYAPLIAQAVPEHEKLILASGAGNLIRKEGWLVIYRTEKARDQHFADIDTIYAELGVAANKLDGRQVKALEPDLTLDAAGAVQWTAPWTVQDPGALVSAYAAYFAKLGGRFAHGDASTLAQSGTGWSVKTEGGTEAAEHVVVALGPWSDAVVRKLGYRLPLFVKRGYHMHYSLKPGKRLNHTLLDTEPGYLLAPMRQGVRITTGAEFAPVESEPTTVQLDGAEAIARTIAPLGERLDPKPWKGARPCTPDMKPIVGKAPRHKGLWFDFGHAHHGLTLGPVTGRMLAEQMGGETPFLPMAPFAVERFL